MVASDALRVRPRRTVVRGSLQVGGQAGCGGVRRLRTDGCVASAFVHPSWDGRAASAFTVMDVRSETGGRVAGGGVEVGVKRIHIAGREVGLGEPVISSLRA